MSGQEKKLRTAARGWVTRAVKMLNAVCEQQHLVDVSELKDAIEQFDNRLSALDVAQTQYELQVKEEELDNEIEEAADFRERARKARVIARKLLADMLEEKDKSDNASVASLSSKVEAKLPKIELPGFSGNPTLWTGFWDQFTAIIDESSLSDVTKFSYLQSLLSGEAKAAIQGLSLTSGHYRIACDILQDRFGRKECIVFAHIQQLLNISIPKQCEVSSLWKLQDDLQAHVRSLETLGIDGEQYGVILTPLILSRLPPDIRMEWARESEGREGDLSWLLEFLQKEIKRRERSQTFKEPTNVSEVNVEKKSARTTVSTAAALQISSKTDKKCNICTKTHHTSHCWELTKRPIKERLDRIRAAGLCFKCLDTGHFSKSCKEKCSKCQGNHHGLLCYPQGTHTHGKYQENVTHEHVNVKQRGGQVLPVEQLSTAPVIAHSSVANTRVTSGGGIILQTAYISVQGAKATTKATVLFDTGSDKSYISKDLVHKIRPDWISSQLVSYAAFGCDKPGRGELRNVFQVQLMGTNGVSKSLLVTEMPVICSPLYRPHIPQKLLDSFGELEFVDMEQGRDVKVDILIGLDAYWKFVKPGIINSPVGVVAQETVFGWMLSGSLAGTEGCLLSGYVSHPLLCLQDISESTLHSFWDLDSIGIRDHEVTLKDPVLEEFQEKVTFIDGRYEVSLPWKGPEAKGKLLDNEKIARHRLESLSRKLDKNLDLKNKYNNVIHDMEVKGIVEEVPLEELVSSHPTFYMPHRPVVKESSVSTKVRPVFDASAPGYNHVSLNDCLNTGPSLIPNLVEILIRFRRWKVALTADIEKAFLQIGVCVEDRDAHRFLWDVDGIIRVMRFLRVPFGNTSSPFLLNATIQYHLDTFPPSRVVEELKQNFYVDDWLSGADSEVDACGMLKEARDIMNQAGMSLTKWGTNSSSVSEMVYQEFGNKYSEGEPIKVLGMKWMSKQDCFSFDGIEVPQGLIVTKRIVLSFIARLFDPLGFLTPYIMLAKCLFQELWKQGLDWDEEVPLEIHTRFTRWLEGLKLVKLWQIPRSYTGMPWGEIVHLQLHGFGDASEKGYGACIYLKALMLDGTWFSTLVISKAKVAPLKKMTLPRLELLGALLCARLLEFVRIALGLPVESPYHCWTDSMVALAWIRSDPSKWKTFVSNRVAQIQELTNPSLWSHCRGIENPADLVSRGILAEELLSNKMWLSGPDFLVSGMSEDIRDNPEFEDGVRDNLESEIVQVETSLVVLETPGFLKFERWGTFIKCLRVIGWILRFVHNMENSSKSKQTGARVGDLSFEELSVAKVKLVYCLQQCSYDKELKALKKGDPVPKNSSIFQLKPFIGKDGLLRVSGRIQFSELAFEEKHPIILPRCHVTMLLVRFQHKLLKHAGVAVMITSLRSNYWIMGLRRLAKNVKRECVSCQRQDSKAYVQPAAPLPELRVSKAAPFMVTGLDHAGPLYCADVLGKKFYILLLTCAVTRAIHLELVSSLSASECLYALRRFVARRGLPSVIYSDNAKSFIATNEHFVRHLGHLSPDWKFIAPRAPWWGGWWERLVRSVKSALRKTIGMRSLSRVELETTLTEIEACINSRPLTFVGDDLDSCDPLTPSHFLIGRCTGFQRAEGLCSLDVSRKALIVRYTEGQDLLDQFWSFWSTDYIRNLPHIKGSLVKESQIQKGSIVLVQEEGSPRLNWPLGRIIEVFTGRDGLVRAVKIKTKRGIFTRPIQRLHRLEVASDDTIPVNQDISDQIESGAPDTSDAMVNQCIPNESMPVKQGVDSIQVSRYGRVIKPRSRLDL